IQKALQKEFPNHKIHLSKNYKVIAKFYCEKRRDVSNDAASLYDDLIRRKDKDPYWFIAINWDRETNIFEHKRAQLYEKYNDSRVVKYLRTLYSSKKAWARAYTAKVFTASIQTTSRVESYNAQIKRLVLNSSISLVELAEVLDASISLFPEVDEALCHFLTPAMIKVQWFQIKSCLNYQASVISKDELIEYQE
ncbi:24488_t:CDS:2, partial [Gigaspora rosea]